MIDQIECKSSDLHALYSYYTLQQMLNEYNLLEYSGDWLCYWCTWKNCM